jgi:hypothetical protein
MQLADSTLDRPSIFCGGDRRSTRRDGRPDLEDDLHRVISCIGSEANCSSRRDRNPILPERVTDEEPTRSPAD